MKRFEFAIWVSIATVCHAANVTGRVELTDSKAGGEKNHSGVVAWLEPIGAPLPPNAPGKSSIAHKKKMFLPHVLAVRTGTKVSFANLDPVFHNAFSNYSGQIFDIGLHPPGSSREVTFVRPGIVRIFCNIHPTMSAVIVVLSSPWFTVTNAAGEFSISAPPGDYRLKFFHERALPDVLTALERPVTVASDDVALGVVTISEAGYLVPPHKNKYGKDYPAVIVDQYGTSGRH